MQTRKHKPVDTQKLRQKLNLGTGGMSLEEKFIGIVDQNEASTNGGAATGLSVCS